MSTVAQKLNALEKFMMELAYESRQTEIKLKHLAEGMEEFKAEMRAFKDEMKVFKDEMKVFKDEMKVFKDEMKVFKDEMKVFKDEMRAFKDEMKAFKDEMNKRWGDLARKMGTLVEDIFVPSLDLAIEKYFGVKVEDLMPRRRVRKGARTVEVDVLALAGELAFVVEVKASPNRVEYVHDFLEKLAELPAFLPEVRERRVIPVYAALSMAGSTVELLTKHRIYAMVVRGDVLEIVNFSAVNY